MDNVIIVLVIRMRIMRIKIVAVMKKIHIMVKIIPMVMVTMVVMKTMMMKMMVTMARTIVRISTRISTRRVHTMRGVRFPLNQLSSL